MNYELMYQVSDLVLNVMLSFLVLGLGVAAWSWAELQQQRKRTEEQNTVHAYQGNLVYQIWKRREFAGINALLEHERDHFGITAVKTHESREALRDDLST